MPEIIISDTSCLIILSKIGELDLLKKLYPKISTTQIIAEEFGENLPSWIEILEIKDAGRLKVLELQIDRGEASAIALALEQPGYKLILDDQKARKVAQGLHLQYTGTLGLIIKGKKLGIISAVKPLLEKIKATNFIISAELEEITLKESDEL